MQVTSIPLPVHVDPPVVSVKLTRAEAYDLAGMLMCAIDFGESDFANELHAALIEYTSNEWREYTRGGDANFLVPADSQ